MLFVPLGEKREKIDFCLVRGCELKKRQFPWKHVFMPLRPVFKSGDNPSGILESPSEFSCVFGPN